MAKGSGTTRSGSASNPRGFANGGGDNIARMSYKDAFRAIGAQALSDALDKASLQSLTGTLALDGKSITHKYSKTEDGDYEFNFYEGSDKEPFASGLRDSLEQIRDKAISVFSAELLHPQTLSERREAGSARLSQLQKEIKALTKKLRQ